MKQIIETIENPKYRRAVVSAILGIFALFLVLPLLISIIKTGGVQGKDDVSFHLNRLLSIADGLKGGQFPVKVYPDALSGFGYASPLFYPDLFLYPFAFLVLIGLPLSISYSLMVFAILFFSGLFYERFAAKFFSIKGSVFTAMLFMGGHYTYAVAVYMAGIGQAMAAVFAPLLLLGIYNLLKEDYSRPQLLLLAMLGFTFSHTLSLLIYGLFLIVVVLLNAKKLFVQKRFWVRTGCIFGLYLLLSAMYFVPLFEQFSTTKFLQSIPWAMLSEFALPIENLFFYGNPIQRRYVVRFSVGIVAFLCLLLVFFVRRTEENKRRLNLLYVLFGVVVLSELLVSNLFPWKLLDKTIVSTIQFPFRLLMIPQLLIPLQIGLTVRELINQPLISLPKRVFSVLAVLIIALNSLYSFVYLPEWNEVDVNEARLHEYIGTGEWLPLYGEMDDIGDFRRLFTQGSSLQIERKEHSVTLTAEVDGKGVFPLLYYKGYTAKDEKGNRLEVTPSENGLVTVTGNGNVTVSYEGTVLQTASTVVSVVTLLGCVAFEIWRCYVQK